MTKLGSDFYQRKNVLQVARDLLGKVLVSSINGIETAGRIVETEAYNGVADKASHAFGGRRTARNAVMYEEGGQAYVYLCYGIHHLFNVVTHVKETPHAVLIRALVPVSGIDTMLKRTHKKSNDLSLTRGPGNLTRALGISTLHNGKSLLGREIFIGDDGTRYPRTKIIASPRIGVDYAGPDALLPYRFYIKDSLYVSGKRT